MLSELKVITSVPRSGFAPQVPIKRSMAVPMKEKLFPSSPHLLHAGDQETQKMAQVDRILVVPWSAA
jgi:hypothetical protein